MSDWGYWGEFGRDDVWDPLAEEKDYEAELLEDMEKRAEDEQNREIERQAFEGRRLCGKNAHAYNDQFDNLEIYNLRQAGKSYREIASIVGCSVNTARNRFKKMLGK